MKNFWRTIAQPPYRNLPWLVWIYVVACFLILHDGGIYTGHLVGFDDQVRMVQVLDWINGSGWYDRTLMRANPPEGFTTIWSRIVDVPIAAVIVAAQQFMPQKNAALVASAVIPMIELAILFAVAPYFVRPLVGKNKSRLIVLFLLFTSLLNLKYFSASGFLVGEASHRPWYTILYLAMFGAAARIAMGSFAFSPVLVLGGTVALITAVGIEGYPMIAGAAAILAFTAWLDNRSPVAARGGDALLLGAIGSLLLLPMHQPPSNLFAVSFAEPSILGAVLIGCAALFLKATQFVLSRFPKSKIISALMLCGIAAVIGALLIWSFPRILDGAAAGLSPAERKMAFGTHFEARPLYAVSHGVINFISLAMPILIGWVAGIYALVRSRGKGKHRQRALAISYLGFALLGGILGNMFSRYYHHAMTTCCAWLLWSWEKIKQTLRKNRNYGLYVFISFVALGPLWMLLVPAIEKDAPFASQVLLFPAAIDISDDPCDSLPVADYINAHYPKDVDVLVPYWLSAQFFYQLDTKVDFLANYPSHDKFIDNYKFFGTQSEPDAQGIVARHKIDLIALCSYPPLFNPTFPDRLQVFAGLLQIGHAPDWLKPVDMHMRTNYRLYEVERAQINGGAP